jgi:hypothetical protein
VITGSSRGGGGGCWAGWWYRVGAGGAGPGAPGCAGGGGGARRRGDSAVQPGERRHRCMSGTCVTLLTFWGWPLAEDVDVWNSGSMQLHAVSMVRAVHIRISTAAPWQEIKRRAHLMQAWSCHVSRAPEGSRVLGCGVSSARYRQQSCWALIAHLPPTAFSAVQSCGACRRMLARFETMSREVRHPS